MNRLSYSVFKISSLSWLHLNSLSMWGGISIDLAQGWDRAQCPVLYISPTFCVPPRAWQHSATSITSNPVSVATQVTSLWAVLSSMMDLHSDLSGDALREVCTVTLPPHLPTTPPQSYTPTRAPQRRSCLNIARAQRRGGEVHSQVGHGETFFLSLSGGRREMLVFTETHQGQRSRES